MWYDEFAIGWNEIFDYIPPTPPRASFQPAAAASSATASSSAAPGNAAIAAGPASPAGQSRSPALQDGSATATPRAKAAASSAPPAAPTKKTSVSESQQKGAFWSSEVLTSKKPPSYLRTTSVNKRDSAIDGLMKEKLLIYPVAQLRKPSEVMEVELGQLRHEMTEAHLAKRKQGRRDRRLARRSRVKQHEDLEFLEEQFAGSEHLHPLTDPADGAETWKPSQPTAKAFFVQLANRHIHGSEHTQESLLPLSAR